MTDDHAVFSKMTGLEYVAFMADVYGVGRREREERFALLSERFALGGKAGALISSYSHGMKQKICMIGSLIHAPSLWILDEPMLGLDPSSMRSVSEFMKDYAAAGNAVLFSTHNLDAVRRICDRVIVIRGGIIRADMRRNAPTTDLSPNIIRRKRRTNDAARDGHSSQKRSARVLFIVHAEAAHARRCRETAFVPAGGGDRRVRLFSAETFCGHVSHDRGRRVSDHYARLYELTAVIYTVIIAVNALGAVRVINRSVFESDDLRILLTLPLPSGAVWLSKMAAAYAKQFVFGLFTVLPVNVTLGVCVPLGAQFYGMTALILVLLPMISLGVGSVLALPVHAVARLISSRYVVTLVVVTAVTAVAFWLYSAVLDFIANLISTGDARYFFDAETMREIARVTEKLFPASCFADMLLTGDAGEGFGWVLLVTAALTAAGVTVGRLMLVPAAQNKLFSLSSRHVYKGHGMPAPRSVFATFMKKEFVQVLRTPSYAFRYFSTAIIMPLMVYFCMDIFSELVGMLVFVNCDLEIAVFLIVMFGILTNTYCAGNISRDGEFFFTMKTLPVNYRTVIGAKVAFCFIGAAVPTAVSVALVGGLGYVNAWQSVYLLAVTLAISVAQICFAIRRDLMRPHFGGSGGAEENATLRFWSS